MLERMRTRLALIVVLVWATTVGSRADSLTGAWTMVNYEGPAAHGSATGLLLFNDGSFSLTYTMDDSGKLWGRAHAGTYDIKDNRLIYHVRWSMEYVDSKPSVAPKPSDRETTFALAGDSLKVTFSNGSVQTFTRRK